MKLCLNGLSEAGSARINSILSHHLSEPLTPYTISVYISHHLVLTSLKKIAFQFQSKLVFKRQQVLIAKLIWGLFYFSMQR